MTAGSATTAEKPGTRGELFGHPRALGFLFVSVVR
jgi:hypothetical protein